MQSVIVGGVDLLEIPMVKKTTDERMIISVQKYNCGLLMFFGLRTSRA